MATVFIYGLSDPDDGTLRYVGQTRNMKSRLWRHLHALPTNHTGCWITGLRDSGKQPEMFVIEESSEDEADDKEHFWISYLRYVGCRLTNLSEGGRFDAEHSLEVRQKMRQAHLGKQQPCAVREKIRCSLRGRVRSEDACRKTSESLMGHSCKPVTEATREKLRVAALKQWQTIKSAGLNRNVPLRTINVVG